MSSINHQLLVELGLGHLEPRQQELIKQRIYEVLEMRVGLALTNSLTTAERDTFEQLIDESPELAQEYLARVVPNYGPAVRRELNFIARAISQSVHAGGVLIGDSEGPKQSNEGPKQDNG